jgi:hypothetical protein
MRGLSIRDYFFIIAIQRFSSSFSQRPEGQGVLLEALQAGNKGQP